MRAYRDLFAAFLLLAAPPALAACGGSVTTDTSSGAGGAGGSGSGGGGDGGAGASGGSGGGAPVVCGGFVGATCPAGQWCDFPDGLCGGADGDGICVPSPSTCTKDCPGVCGCDNKFYCNACIAQAAGVDTADMVSCAPASGEYTAQAVFGGLDHIMIFKADPVRNICVITHLARPSMSQPEFMVSLPAEWGLVNAVITDTAVNCNNAGVPPVGKSVNATGALGSVVWNNVPPGGFFPCDLNVHMTLLFPPGEPFVNAKEPLDADALTIKNGCI